MDNTKAIKVSDFIAAAEKNGYPWTGNVRYSQNSLHHKGTTLTCVVGQGMINLGVHHWPFSYPFDKERNRPVYHAFDKVMAYNDHDATSFEDALRFMKTELAPYVDEVVYL